MSVAVRLAGFAAVLALVFGVTLAIGSASDVRPQRAAKAAHATGMSGMAEAGHGAAEAPRGLGVAEGGLRLVADTTSFSRDRTQPFTFRIVDARGATVRDFDVEHTKRLHLIAVRRDLT